jgi:putative FmdB family regulatory protein
MPVYVYHCENCEYQFEQQQKFSDNPLKTCPHCGKSTLHKVYMPVGVIYKGSGFYSTDHRSNSGSSTHSIRPEKENKTETEIKTKEAKASEKTTKSE